MSSAITPTPLQSVAVVPAASAAPRQSSCPNLAGRWRVALFFSVVGLGTGAIASALVDSPKGGTLLAVFNFPMYIMSVAAEAAVCSNMWGRATPYIGVTTALVEMGMGAGAIHYDYRATAACNFALSAVLLLSTALCTNSIYDRISFCFRTRVVPST